MPITVGNSAGNLKRKYVTGMKDKFNTKLDPDVETEYQNFVNQASVDTGRDYSKNEDDYDLRGFFKEKAQSGLKAANTHGPDTYKKPNHPTFSNESKYSNDKTRGGVWLEGDFMPSDQQLDSNEKVKKLKQYWKRAEPGKLLLPEGK